MQRHSDSALCWLRGVQVPDDQRSSTVQLLRELYFNRTGVLFLFMAVLSILMIVESARTKGSVSQFWLGLGTATIATTGYSLVQILLTTRQFDRFLSNTIKADIQESMSQIQAAYMPVATYPALETANRGFNLELNRVMSASSRYLFRGMSARYAVARLSLLPRPPREIALIIADPTKPAAVDSRARHDAAGQGDAAFERARQDILDGIHMSIAGAYTNRRRYDRIEFGLTPVPYVDRIEICDDAIFISRFSEDDATRFPSTVIFGRDSLIYQMLYRDCSGILGSPYVRRLELPGDLPEEDFLGKLGAMGISITPERWAEMKRKFEDFRVQVRSQLMPS
jgi:hypothetical protein